VLLYAMLLRRNGVPELQIAEAAASLAREWHPPLPASKCRSTVKDALRYRHVNIRHATCAAWFAVTDEEKRRLVRWFPPQKKPLSSAADRRALVRAEIERLGAVPSLSRMGEHLADLGHPVSRSQVSIDYKRMGISAARPGRLQRSAVTQGSLRGAVTADPLNHQHDVSPGSSPNAAVVGARLLNFLAAHQPNVFSEITGGGNNVCLHCRDPLTHKRRGACTATIVAGRHTRGVPSVRRPQKTEIIADTCHSVAYGKRASEVCALQLFEDKEGIGGADLGNGILDCRVWLLVLKRSNRYQSVVQV
jgi:hypothetical protein